MNIFQKLTLLSSLHITFAPFTSSCKLKSAKNRKNLNSSSERFYESMVLQKKQILEENTKRCGIYLLTNTINGKRYVGSSVDFVRRFVIISWIKV